MFNDADPVAAANGAAFACFIASGQTCVSGTRLLVQDEIYDEFMLHFMHKVESIRIRMGDRKLSFSPTHSKYLLSARSNEPQVNDGHRHFEQAARAHRSHGSA